MASFSTTKIFAGLLSITAADLDAIVAQLSAAPGLISDRPAAGAAVDGDLFLVLKGGVLQQMTALQLKTYLGQVFVPSAFADTAAPVVVTTAAFVLSPTWTQLLASITFTTIAGSARKVMFWASANLQPVVGAGTGLTLAVYRQDNVNCGTLFTATAGGTLSFEQFSAQFVDKTPLNGSTTYYLLAQSTVANCTVNYASLSGVLM